VFFVADPAVAPARPGVVYARPDATDSDGISWRKKLVVSFMKSPAQHSTN
jgi:hypothetical protein